jgi:arginine decarboxylase
MKEQIDAAIKSDVLKPSEGMRLLESYERGLQGSTYLQFT